MNRQDQCNEKAEKFGMWVVILLTVAILVALFG